MSITQDYDIICLLETFLGLSIPYDDERINIEGYITAFCGRMIHVAKKREGVFMYYREYLSKTKGDDLSTLKESLATELMMSKKKFFLPCSWRSPIDSR